MSDEQQQSVSVAPVVDALEKKVESEFEIFKTEGNSFVKMEKYDLALTKYEEAWKHCRTDDDRAMILNNKGVVLEKLGDSDKALQILGEALALKPGYIKVLIRRAIVYKKLKKYEEALDDIAEAQVLALKNQQTVGGLQDTVDTITYDYAEEEFERLTVAKDFGIPKGTITLAFLRGFTCDQISRYYKGTDPLPVVDGSASAQGDALEQGFVAALNCLKANDFSGVLDNATVEIAKTDSKFRLEAFLLRSAILFVSGKREETSADLNIIVNDPDASNELKSSAHLKLALLANVWKNSEEAAEHFKQAEQLWKENADVYYHGAVCLVEKGEVVPALALLEKGMEVCADPKKYPSLHVMGLTIKVSYDMCVGIPKDTTEKLQKLEEDGIFDSPECYELYGQTLLVSGKFEEALLQFDKAIELSGGEKLFEMKKVIAQNMIKSDTDAAIESLSKFVDEPEIGSSAQYHIGELSIICGKTEEGFAAIEKSIESASSVYDLKARIAGKHDFKYNVLVHDKMKKYKLVLENDETKEDKALE